MSFTPEKQEDFTNQKPRSQNGGTPEQAVATTTRPAEGYSPPMEATTPSDIFIYGQKK